MNKYEFFSKPFLTENFNKIDYNQKTLKDFFIIQCLLFLYTYDKYQKYHLFKFSQIYSDFPIGYIFTMENI